MTMTRDEWKNYKDFDELKREMAGGFAANDLFGAGMTHLSAASLLQPKDLKRTNKTESDTLRAE